MSTNEGYVDKHQDCYRITGTRVSLDSIVYAFLDGDSPETIAHSFPLLTLEQVYGAITYYLSHRGEVEKHLLKNRAKFDAPRKKATHPLLYRKLEECKRPSLEGPFPS